MKQRDQSDHFSGRYLQYGVLGFEFVVSVVVCIVIGYLVDRQWDLRPVGMLAGLVVGFVLGFYTLINGVAMMEREDNDRDKSNRDGSS